MMRDRLEQVLWVVAYLADLEADLLRFYGIEDMLKIESARFFRLALRVIAYEGVLTARFRMEEKEEQEQQQEVQTLADSGGEVVQVSSQQTPYWEQLLAAQA